jgi:hypothetical protein
MEDTMKHILLLATVVMIMGGCSNSNNPVASTSETVNSGTLQYTLSIPKEIYTTQDTLNVTLIAHNIGSVTDTMRIGSAVLCEWSLNNASGKVMFSGKATGNSFTLAYIPPGESKLVDAWIHALTDSNGNPLTPDSYSFNVNYSGNLFSLHLIVQ